VLFASFNKLTRSMLPAPPRKAAAAVQAAEAREKGPGLWKRFDRRFLTRAVPVEREADVMMHHDYDGIRELDNKLPPWWVWGFYVTILWAFGYLIHYHVSHTGKLSAAEYRADMQKAALAHEEYLRKKADLVTEENVVALTDAAALDAGKDIYVKNCAVCHLASGGGQVGPNLTDEYWIHGGGMRNIFKVITHGVPAKGMIAWKAQLTPKQIQQVGSYVLTFKGTNPAGGKEPQGERWTEPEAAPAPADTAAPPAGAPVAQAIR
jgi:cytochrome c oxidase cbb3-type subunit 3